MSDSRVHAICMAYDAFRLCLAVEPKNFTYSEVIEWILKMHIVKPQVGTTEKEAL